LLDRYFRIISGNTQVNATEIRSLRFPRLGRVAEIGHELKALEPFRPVQVERVVLGVLGINGRIADVLTGSSS